MQCYLMSAPVTWQEPERQKPSEGHKHELCGQTVQEPNREKYKPSEVQEQYDQELSKGKEPEPIKE